MHRLTFIFFLAVITLSNAQKDPIKLFKQFNGRYSYTAVGNTLNKYENNEEEAKKNHCKTLDSSASRLIMDANSKIIAAYLYWAGSGLGDKNVTLKTLAADSTATDSIKVNAFKTYNVEYTQDTLLTYFSCYKDISTFVKKNKSSIYQLSDLNINELLSANKGYCFNGTNFAGWCIYVIYENDNLPLNQVNLFQGLEIINQKKQNINIELDNINVIDNLGAKIGFLAWEGDKKLSVTEEFYLNENKLFNDINPVDNAFNSTNSFATDSLARVTLFNMDMDVYDIENFIKKGDKSVKIRARTGKDLIIFNNIITVFNSQIPDASINANTITTRCYERIIDVSYTVYNVNCTDELPSNTPIAFYANDILVGQSETKTVIPIGGSENGIIELTIPESIIDDFDIKLVVDDDGTGTGVVDEINEDNNTDIAPLIRLPRRLTIDDIKTCDKGYNTGIFNLNDALTDNLKAIYDDFKFYASEDDIINKIEILNTENYASKTTPQTIYVEANHPDKCDDILTFQLNTKNCPPLVPDGFSPNGDGKNDYFNIQGLYTIFEQHELLIYNRYGTLIFKGNDNTKWYGKSNQGLNNVGDVLPVGTYFYVINLNDVDYKKPLTGWVYLNK